MDGVRSGVGGIRPSRVRGADVAGPGRAEPADRGAAMGLRVSAEPVPRGGVARQRRPGDVSGRASRDHARAAEGRGGRGEYGESE